MFGLIDHDYSTSSPDKDVHCIICGWRGKLYQTRKRLVNSSLADWMSLCGREGVEYDCPKCGMIVHAECWKMS